MTQAELLGEGTFTKRHVGDSWRAEQHDAIVPRHTFPGWLMIEPLAG